MFDYWQEQRKEIKPVTDDLDSFKIHFDFIAKNDISQRYSIHAASHLKSYNAVFDEATARFDLINPEKKSSLTLSDMLKQIDEGIEKYNNIIDLNKKGKVSAIQTDKGWLTTDKPESLLEARNILLGALDRFLENVQTVKDDFEIGSIRGECAFDWRSDRKL